MKTIVFLFLLILILILHVVIASGSGIYNVLDFGAIRDSGSVQNMKLNNITAKSSPSNPKLKAIYLKSCSEVSGIF
jgi:hypothetical protein